MKKTTRLTILGLLLSPIAILGIAISRAQTATPSAVPTPMASPAPVGSPTPSAAPTVAAPKVIGMEGHLELDVIIKVEVDHLAEWAAKNDASKLVPYLNGRAITGDYPEEIHASKNHLHFHLKITPENKNVWVDLLGEPNGTKRPVSFSVGLENHSPFDSVFDQSNQLPLTVISPVYGMVALVVVLVTDRKNVV